jgi:hypothetical protein
VWKHTGHDTFKAHLIFVSVYSFDEVDCRDELLMPICESDRNCDGKAENFF